MTKMLISDTNPTGLRLEDALRTIRNDILVRCSNMSNDGREQAEHVLANNMHILPILSEAIAIAEDSTAVLGRSFGTDDADKGQMPT
ncbi:MAG: histidine kinase [Rhodospirillales bacterium]|nr:histidine kinase [Rhodospirillales bacterium]MBT4040449.1 histidine kinase [Rhodospirillales bacterium]MBT4625845.1 histidine kinase [Rhodospirillales bacterium]MBT5351647.1 histidine kinase [Rhodospirillales bacterium]MBT5521324.1 histidine kinase [Rhodospirillales bacterium]